MQTKDFLQDLAGNWGIEVNNLTTSIPLEQAIGKKNIYFVCGFDSKKNRVSDDDFTKKKYIFIDIDIRKSVYDKEKRVITDDELREIVVDIGNILDDKWLSDYSYSVFSGNGLHLYYVGDEIETNKKEYSDAVKYFHTLINFHIGKLGLECDQACSNIARISRLPGTINTRVKIQNWVQIRDMWEIECQLLTSNPKKSVHIQKIKEYAKLYNETQEIEKRNTEYIKNISRDVKSDDRIFEEINKIPAREIAEIAWWVEYKNCEKDNCPLLEWHKNMWAYYWKPSNVVVNTGSSLVKHKDEKYWTTYRLARDEIFSGDVKKTIDFFKVKYWIVTEPKGTVPQKKKYESVGYVYWNETFESFGCMMSGELVVIVSKTNSGKTTFAMNMLQENKNLMKKWFYINLEFPIETVAKKRWLDFNWKTKLNLTDIAPLTDPEKLDMQNYIQKYLSRFDYFNAPQWLTIEELIEVMLKKLEEQVYLFVIDTFSRIKWNLDWANAHKNQNNAMEKLQEFAQNTGACIILLHHTNKTGVFEGSQKIMDLANVFITIGKEDDPRWQPKTKFILSKDKFVTDTEIFVDYVKWEYILSK